MSKNLKIPCNNLGEQIQKVWKLRFSEGRRALEIAKSIESEAWENNDIYAFAEIRAYISLLNYWFSEPGDYLKDLLNSSDTFSDTENYCVQSRIKNIIAMLYDHYGNYEKGLEYSRMAIQLAKKSEMLAELADAITTEGQIYLRINDFELALNSFRKALEIRKNEGYLKAEGSSINLIARTYTLLKDYKNAKENYLLALNIRKKSNDNFGLPWTYLGLATVAYEEDSFQEAIDYFIKGLELNKVLPQDKRYNVLARKGLSEVYFKTEDFESSKQQLDLAYELARELNLNPYIADLNNLLSIWYEKKGDYKLSHHYLKEYIKIMEKIHSNEITHRLRNQQIAFSVEEERIKAEIFQLRNVELKNAFNAIEEKNHQIIDSINYAQRIQKAILPSPQAFLVYFPDSFVLLLPKDIVSGDFHWISEHKGKILFSVVDCTGHGVPGAFVSIIGKIGLDTIVNEFNISSPAQILNKLNHIITETFEQSEDEIKDGMDLALCSIDKQKMFLEYAGAKNPLYLLRNKELIVYKPDRISIEGTTSTVNFTNHKIDLLKGDRLYIFSDGIIDQFGGPKNKKYLQKRLKELLLETINLSMKEQERYLLSSFVKWKGEMEQTDDVSIVGIQI